MDSKAVAVSLCCGAGGLDYGLNQAGFRFLVGVATDADALATYQRNSIADSVYAEDVCNLTASWFRRELGLARGDLDLLVSGPPCQPFSKSRFWVRNKPKGFADTRSLVFSRLLSLARSLHPRAILLENVPMLGAAYNKHALEQFCDGLCQQRYTVWQTVLNASNFGVPQHRRRLFILAVRNLRPQEETTDLEQALRRYGRPAWTPRKVLHGGPRQRGDEDLTIRSKWANLLQEIPPGENYLHLTKERGHPRPQFQWRSKYWNFLLKLHPDRPSWTIQSSPGPATGPFHWENRRLSTFECQLLQGFPRSFVFLGNRVKRQRQIGNAVPPPVGRAIGAYLLSEFFD
jgi:DNA (cytosine-5)-methyltransferase 1